MSDVIKLTDKRVGREDIGEFRPRVPHPRQHELEAMINRLEAEGRNPRVEEVNGRIEIVVDPLAPEPMEARRIAALTQHPTRKVDGINTLFSDRQLKTGEEFVPVNRKQAMMRLTTDDMSGKWVSDDE